MPLRCSLLTLLCSVQSSEMYSQEPHLCLSPTGNSLLCSCSVTSFLHSLCLIFMSHADVRKILFLSPVPPQFRHYPHYNKRVFICQDCFPLFARFLQFLISFSLLILKILLFYKFIFQIFKISVPFFLCFF